MTFLFPSLLLASAVGDLVEKADDGPQPGNVWEPALRKLLPAAAPFQARGVPHLRAGVAPAWTPLSRGPAAGSGEGVPEVQALQMRGGRIHAKEKVAIGSVPSEEDYEQLIQDAQAADRLVVIKMYASWCRACKAFGPKFENMAQGFPDVQFVELLYDNNKKLCKKLGIKVLPYIQIVDGDKGIVDSFSCGPSKLPNLKSKLEGKVEERQW